MAGLFPVPWSRLRLTLREVHRRAGRTGAPAKQFSGRALVLLFPDWAAELAGVRVPLEELRAIQARVLAAVLARDQWLDKGGDGSRVGPLFADARQRLLRFFPEGHPFW